MFLDIMRFSPDLLTSNCSWPYQSIELLVTFSWKGDMAEKDNPVLPPEVHTTTNKSPNVSTDSGFECEKGTSPRDPLSSEEVSLSLWTNENRCNRLETHQTSCPCSPQSPLKHLDDSDFNESPLEKRTIGSFSIDSDSVFHRDNSTEKCCVTDLPIHSRQIVAASPSSNDLVPSVLLVSESSDLQNDKLVLYPINNEVVVQETFNNASHSCRHESDYQPSDACLSQAEQSCDETYSDEALSTYYVPSSVSMAMDDTYSQSSARPPRSSLTGVLRRGETCSEADASEPSRKCQTTYKSLRSQSDPSTHYTTVLKPIAIKPDPVNLDGTEFRSSMESLHLRQISAALVRYQNRRSAFREHLRSTLSQCEGVNVLFSRSLGTPPSSESPVRNYVDVSRGTPHSSPIQLTPTRACSLNDVTNDSHFQCAVKLTGSSSSLQPDMCLAHSSNLSKSNGCFNGLACSKRHSMPVDVNGTRKKSSSSKQEPIHMTLEEVRNSLQTLNMSPDGTPTDEKKSPCRQFIRAYLRSRKSKRDEGHSNRRKMRAVDKSAHRRSFPSSVKAAFSSWFGFKRTSMKSQESSKESNQSREEVDVKSGSANTSPFMNRALPPLPIDEANLWGPTVTVDEESSSPSVSDSFSDGDNNHNRMRKMDYAASIEKVKDCGWYWGPISGETAEKLLASEPDGSFVLRDSSDEHYIFSLTFKLNGLVRHVRIEHDHGNFSFGCLQKFRSNTIVDFIENAVEHSRSGRYLFFLHRRPILGPMRVQLLHPVSRFKQVQSLQHLCRFVILKTVRRDLIDKLPLPRRLKDYLNTPHYYSEELAHLPLPSTGTQQQQQQQQPFNSSLLNNITNTTASQEES